MIGKDNSWSPRRVAKGVGIGAIVLTTVCSFAELWSSKRAKAEEEDKDKTTDYEVVAIAESDKAEAETLNMTRYQVSSPILGPSLSSSMEPKVQSSAILLTPPRSPPSPLHRPQSPQSGSSQAMKGVRFDQNVRFAEFRLPLVPEEAVVADNEGSDDDWEFTSNSGSNFHIFDLNEW